MAKAVARAWSPASATPTDSAATAAPSTPPQLLALGEGPVAWADSPARQLHARLAATFVAPPPAIDDTLSPRVKLAIMVGSTAFLWSILAALVAVVR